MEQERAMMIFLSYQKLRMPTFSKFSFYSNLSRFYLDDIILILGVRQRRTENPLRERLLVRKFITQLET